ncbi:hypothetical protein TrRE_jg2511 [Triparma retinervis]|uniref:PH domain-containing protein n=1 Tax=Triparma retinervis TaxID=2557542 RepID=A0A9W7FVJ4_9STRA|nr:hypothetical protein TrRE_jg2511 [Triparma retinervis]
MSVRRESFLLVSGRLRYCVLKEGILTTYAPDLMTTFDRYFSLWLPCLCSFRKKHPVGEKLPITDVPKSRFILSICEVTEFNAGGVTLEDHNFESSDPRLWRIKVKGEHYTTYFKPVKQETADLDEFKLWSRDLKNVAHATKRWTRAENVVTLPGTMAFSAVEGAKNGVSTSKKKRLKPDSSPQRDGEFA